MQTEITFQGLGPGASAHNCQNGEMAALVGAIPAHSALERVSSPQWQYSIPAGYKALGIHHTPDGDNCILTSTAGALAWMPLDGSSEPDVTDINAIPLPCHSMAAVGNMVAIASAKGLMRMLWSGSAYTWLGSGPEMPVIEFGLEKAGVLSMAKAYRVPAVLAPMGGGSTGQPGSGAWTTHPTALQQTQDCASAIATISADIRDAIERQIESRGMWHQPFFVRYALRLHDGSHTLPSPPILMLPSVLPPCISVGSVQATDSDDVRLLTLDASTCPFFELRCRVARGLDPKWMSLVQAVDIYATPQILAYHEDAAACKGIVAYSALIGQANNTAWSDRGRPSSRSAAAEDAFLGHFSDSGGYFHDFTVGDYGLDDTNCWDLAPDPALRHKLLSASDYRLIASIPFANMHTQSAFTAVGVSTTKAAAMRQAPALECDWLSHYKHIPEVAYAFNRRLLIGGGGIEVPSPLHPRCTIAASGPAGSSATVTTEAAIIAAGNCTKAQWIDAPYIDADAFPRYIHVANSNASAILLKQGERCWRIPLSRHESIGGACWLGSLTANPQEDYAVDPDDFAEEAPTHIAFVPERATVYTGAADNPLVFTGSTTVGDGRLIALQAALQPMSQGQFGQFPLYAFATDGIWALTSTDAGYATRQPVSRDVCVSPRAIVATDQGVAFVSQRGVMMVHGAKFQDLSDGLLRSSAAKIATLPKIDALCMPGLLPSIPSIIADSPMLSYDSAHGRLWLYADNGGMAMVCATATGHWAMADADIAAPVWGEWVQDRSGRLAPLSLAHQGIQKTLLITRPIKAEQPVRASALRAVRINGRLAPESVKMVVYGSNDLIAWHIIASAEGNECAHLAGTPYRYHIVAATALLTTHQDLASVTLTT